MDGVKMDPKTGRPIESAKIDLLFAYGERLTFQLRMDIQDIREQDTEAISVLFHLIQDFQRGDIPLGGSKTSGLGWVKANVDKLIWLTADPEGVSKPLFGDRELEREGLWQKLVLEGEAAASALQAASRAISMQTSTAPDVPKARAGFVSHRAFGGYCGTLAVEAEVLTPTHVRESGEPSSRATLPEGPVNGWDFFSMSPPQASMRDTSKLYALPSKSIKGMIRHIYTIASDSKEPSLDVSRLNPVDSLFGWVGSGPNQAIMGRLAFSFGMFDAPELAWYKVPYPYGEWEYTAGQWRRIRGNSALVRVVGKSWRVFTHAPLAPIVKTLEDFRPDTFQASYFRAILPGARARFTIRFWNLDEQELSRLIWCVVLEPQLAHKVGKHRYMGFGSLRLQVLPDSFIIDWTKRYTGYGKPEKSWQLPIDVERWIKPGAIFHSRELQKLLNANQL
jgi:CRISPR/Cas system CSM-associated protein Csm3 (group 7 of RAMP superfamily)